MRTKKEIWADAQRLTDERDMYAQEVMKMMSGKSGMTEQEQSDRMDVINARMLELVHELEKLNEEAKELRQAIDNHDIIN